MEALQQGTYMVPGYQGTSSSICYDEKKVYFNDIEIEKGVGVVQIKFLHTPLKLVRFVLFTQDFVSMLEFTLISFLK